MIGQSIGDGWTTAAFPSRKDAEAHAEALEADGWKTAVLKSERWAVWAFRERRGRGNQTDGVQR